MPARLVLMGTILTIITAGMPTNDIIVIHKLLFLIIWLLVLTISASTFAQNRQHADYVQLAEDVRYGRFVLGDLGRLAPYMKTKHSLPETCNSQTRKTLAVLALYVSDLAAQNAEVTRRDEQDNLWVQYYRAQAMSRVRNVLTCAPLDGDMWFRLSILSFILNLDRKQTEAFLSWSDRTAPHETWIKNHRDDFVRSYLNPK